MIRTIKEILMEFYVNRGEREWLYDDLQEFCSKQKDGNYMLDVIEMYGYGSKTNWEHENVGWYKTIKLNQKALQVIKRKDV